MFLCLGICQSSAYALNEQYYGEWLFNYSAKDYADPALNDTGKTIADRYETSGASPSFVIHPDGTMEICVAGRRPGFGTWVETNDGAAVGREKVPAILVADNAGVLLNSIPYKAVWSQHPS